MGAAQRGRPLALMGGRGSFIEEFSPVPYTSTRRSRAAPANESGSSEFRRGRYALARMLEKVLAVINKMVEDRIIEDYAIGGAIAALFYIEPFETLDLDIVVFLPQEEMSKAVVSLTPLYTYLRELGYNEEKEYVIIETVPVQFLVGGKPLLDDAVKTAVPKAFRATPTKVMRVEYLLALMADRCQAKDKARAQLVKEQGVEVDYDLVDAIIKEHHLEAKWKTLIGLEV